MQPLQSAGPSRVPTPTSSYASRFREFRDRIDSRPLKPIHLRLILIALTLFYLGLTAAQAWRPLWHDELYTYYVATSPSWAALWRNIHLDLNPPLIFITERLTLLVFGDNFYTERIPVIVGFFVGSMCLARFVSKAIGPIYGLFAVIVFWSTPFEYFATELRPYGLVIGFFGIVMLLWQKATEAGRKPYVIPALALAVTGLMGSHMLGLFYITPFCCAELYRWFQTRRFDWAMWSALILPSILLLFYIPLMSRYESGVFPAGSQASPAKLIGFFYRMLEPEALSFFLALVIALLVGFRRNRSTREDSVRFSTLEWILIWELCLIPVLVTAAMMRSHGVAFPRYSGPAVFLYGILFAYLLAKWTHGSRSAALAGSLVLLLYLAADNLGAAQKLRAALKGVLPGPEPIASVKPDLPLVTASGIKFLEMDQYSDPSTVHRLYYLTDRKLAIQYAHATLFEGIPDLIGKFPIRAHVEPYPKFVEEHDHFLVLGQMHYPEEWLLRRLADIHASLQYLGDYPGGQLYLVTMPGHDVPRLDR